MKFVGISLLTFALLAPISAKAQDNWSIQGNGCVPSNTTTTGDLHTTTVSSVKFDTGKTGIITLFCAIPRFNSGTSSYTADLTYRDSSGTGPGAYVRAEIYKMPHGSAVPQLLGTADSNTSAATGTNTLASPQFNETFDFENNLYWARIVMRRGGPGQIVMFHSLVLNGTSF